MLAAFLAPDLADQIHGFLAIPPTIAEVWMVGYLLIRGVGTSQLGEGTPAGTAAIAS
jgi:hypothetical protein